MIDCSEQHRAACEARWLVGVALAGGVRVARRSDGATWLTTAEWLGLVERSRGKEAVERLKEAAARQYRG